MQDTDFTIGSSICFEFLYVGQDMDQNSSPCMFWDMDMVEKRTLSPFEIPLHFFQKPFGRIGAGLLLNSVPVS